MGTDIFAVILSAPFAVATALCGIAAAAALLLSRKQGKALPIKRKTILITITALAVVYFLFLAVVKVFFGGTLPLF